MDLHDKRHRYYSAGRRQYFHVAQQTPQSSRQLSVLTSCWHDFFNLIRNVCLIITSSIFVSSILKWWLCTLCRFVWQERLPSWVERKLQSITRKNLCLQKSEVKFADAVRKSIGMNWKPNMIKFWRTMNKGKNHYRRRRPSELQQHKLLLQNYSQISFCIQHSIPFSWMFNFASP